MSSETSTSRFVGTMSSPAVRRFGPIWVITVVLFVACAIFVPGSVKPGTLTTMLPFAAILMVAAVGQTFVIQQRGIDLSVPTGISVGAAVLTQSGTSPASVVLGIVLAILAGAGIGLVNGLVISYLSVTPLIATLAVNSLGLGLVLVITGGSPKPVAGWLHSLSVHTVLGIPHLLILGVAVTILAALLTRYTTFGRALVAIGAGAPAARVAGIGVQAHRIAAYVIAGACYGLAGVMAAGYLTIPDVYIGNEYLLSSVAAVVVGGTALTGGLASFTASAIGALFMSQLNQVVLSLGAPYATQLLVQAGALVVVVGGQVVVRAIRNGARLPAFARRTTDTTAAPPG